MYFFFVCAVSMRWNLSCRAVRRSSGVASLGEVALEKRGVAVSVKGRACGVVCGRRGKGVVGGGGGEDAVFAARGEACGTVECIARGDVDAASRSPCCVGGTRRRSLEEGDDTRGRRASSPQPKGSMRRSRVFFPWRAASKKRRPS